MRLSLSLPKPTLISDYRVVEGCRNIVGESSTQYNQQSYHLQVRQAGVPPYVVRNIASYDASVRKFVTWICCLLIADIMTSVLLNMVCVL